MKWQTCGATMRPSITALPFKVSDSTIVILKDLPVIECDNCPEFLIEVLSLKVWEIGVETSEGNLFNGFE